MANLTVPINVKIDMDEIREYLASNDVVEIVRCKDCIHRKKYECIHIALGSFRYGRDDFYCAEGEREETECGV